jgi:hypothetical protein
MTTKDKTTEIGRVAYYNSKTHKFSIARAYHITCVQGVYYSIRFLKNDGATEILGEDKDLNKALNNYCLRSEFAFYQIIPFYPRSVLSFLSIDAYDFDSEVQHG